MKAVESSRPLRNGLTIVPGTIPVGAGLVTDGQMPPGSVDWFGNSQPAEVFVGKHVLSVSVWKGLWSALDPAYATVSAVFGVICR